MKNVTVKAGQSITLEANFSAEPLPTAVWHLKNEVLNGDERVSNKVEPKSVKLVIANAKRSDTGSYTLKLTNLSGSASASCDVVVLSAPGMPKGPLEVKDVKKFDIYLTNCFLLLNIFKSLT